MDFTINRTSNDWDKPCKGAYQDVIHRNYQGNRIDVWKIKIRKRHMVLFFVD